jgi:hypothetical protein
VLDALLILNAGGSMNDERNSEILSTLTGQLYCSHVAVNTASPLSVCTKERQSAVTGFWGGGMKASREKKSIADFQHNMETVLYRREICTNE